MYSLLHRCYSTLLEWKWRIGSLHTCDAWWWSHTWRKVATDPKWYHVCWPRLTAKRIAPVVSISWASCCSVRWRAVLLKNPPVSTTLRSDCSGIRQQSFTTNVFTIIRAVYFCSRFNENSASFTHTRDASRNHRVMTEMFTLSNKSHSSNISFSTSSIYSIVLTVLRCGYCDFFHH